MARFLLFCLPGAFKTPNVPTTLQTTHRLGLGLGGRRERDLDLVRERDLTLRNHAEEKKSASRSMSANTQVAANAQPHVRSKISSSCRVRNRAKEKTARSAKASGSSAADGARRRTDRQEGVAGVFDGGGGDDGAIVGRDGDILVGVLPCFVRRRIPIFLFSLRLS